MSAFLVFTYLAYAAGTSCPLPSAPAPGAQVLPVVSAGPPAPEGPPMLIDWRPGTHTAAPPLDRRAPSHLRVATFALG